jgi:membrane-associated phospholipid phosphatase
MLKVADNGVPSGNPRKRQLRRLLWLAVILASMLLYFPINRLMQGGVQLSLPLDQDVPFYPPFIIPYFLGNLIFVGLPVWAAIRARSGEFEAFAISLLLATMVSYIVYITFPTYVARPDVASGDIFSNAISTLYQTDRSYNAAPSGHAFYSTLSFLYLARWKPRYKLAWLAAWLIILASTLLIRQHNILDLASGLALAAVTYMAGCYARKKRNLKFAS